ncbi:Atypical/ABC1/ABC1-A protein kinase [Mycena indigotica]|uniref:Atypical/ABC1/ABC1-A protein kinase n=1 Tax=Mycena indigotica TaxID=2126181 RepID=A0A8H6T7M9_9AGAR|nr:Atypical/ABC1/ABC1-A protein kinase [Mycena indigotica]KAF7312563.1 Atypical/ABC1/ABC1-A protein kinase [Mycena indigotica]
MPPGPVYNWACVVSSAADILVRAARIRAVQLAKESVVLQQNVANTTMGANPPQLVQRDEFRPVAPATFPLIGLDASLEQEEHSNAKSPTAFLDPGTIQDGPEPPPQWEPVGDEPITSTSPVAETSFENLPTKPLDSLAPSTSLDTVVEATSDDLPVITRQLQASKVPASRIGRLFHYGGLAASLGYGAASEFLRRSTTSQGDESQQQSLMLTEANVTRLVSKLSQMRGAALKLGQFLSIQDTHVLPAQVDAIFRKVQDSANYMPDWQMEQVMQGDLGSWQDVFESFDRIPFAAASIGQVHTATLTATASPTGLPARVAVKIQFPNIANSITSDLGYVSMMLTAGKMLPKGLFLDRTMKVMKEELADECNYAREADSIRKFRSHLVDDVRFRVPWVWEGSTERVLVMEHVDGVSVGDASILSLAQEERNEIASRVIELCLMELFSFQLMQTDPNYSNFLWDSRSQRLALIDFGATRAYGKEFMDGWLKLLQAAAAGNREACIEESKRIGYLTGEENEIMLHAHTESLILLATPFAPRSVTPQPFAFGPGTAWAGVTQQIREHIPVMIQNRLTPPPRETYSLNRKLSGAFLLASRLGATMDTRGIWEKVVDRYQFLS